MRHSAVKGPLVRKCLAAKTSSFQQKADYVQGTSTLHRSSKLHGSSKSYGTNTLHRSSKLHGLNKSHGTSNSHIASKLHETSKFHGTSKSRGSSTLHESSNVLIIAASIIVLLDAYVTVWLFFAMESSQSSSKLTYNPSMPVCLNGATSHVRTSTA